jgi:high-affinity iron transporter
MLPAFLITFREVIEASLIVAMILGILVKLRQNKGIRTTWLAVGTAMMASVVLLGMGSILGLRVQEIYEKNEPYIEGVLMYVSALFITWAVFFLHTYFSNYKQRLIVKIKKSIADREQKGLFFLVFTAVFREGFEIVLFLSTIYFSANPQQIFLGFAGGLLVGLLVSLALFGMTKLVSVYHAYRISSALLILFAAGLLARGTHEFAEAGLLPEIGKMTLTFIPQKGTYVADMLKSVFGITQKMDLVQMFLYGLYMTVMGWYVFFRKTSWSELALK